ncbi:hypothetical protein A3Q29_10545 [Providencia stuartii]|uniref:Uncharacterized protein n=1 Tax=Providencia stuartii TaxID=588 RepID=A0A1S1HKI4_PROST|nr:hypothetical protein A3Q29_10545 [Providencia stuartii]
MLFRQFVKNDYGSVMLHLNSIWSSSPYIGVELICANSPQAKGRIARANKTRQDRLIKEMRLKNIRQH